MRRFLKHTGLFCLPLIVLVVVGEIVAEAIPNSYTYKREYMEEHGGEVKTLVLGSSNAYDGLNPSVMERAFNLANSSQTLEDDYRLLAKYIETMDSLQTVIVGLGYHSLGAVTEDNRRTYYTIYMGLYPRWPISKYSFEVCNPELLAKKIIKYVVSRDVTRCDSLGQRLGHTAEAVKEQKEFWNKDAKELAENDTYIDKLILDKKNNKKIEESLVTDSDSTVIAPHSACMQVSRQIDDPFRLTDTNAQCLSNDSPIKNTKNNFAESAHCGSVIERNIGYLHAIMEKCEAYGVQAVVVTMPVTGEYKQYLAAEQVAFHDSVMQSLPASAIYIDASEWPIPEDGWYNATHLTREASTEFTMQIMNIQTDIF